MCVLCVCKCVCPGEEFALVSRSRCEAEVHNGLINLTRAAYNEHGSRDREEMIPRDHPGPGILQEGGGGGVV